MKKKLTLDTFEYPIPARVFMKNECNLLGTTVLLTQDIEHIKYKVVRRDKNLLWVVSEEVEGEQKTHIDCCWIVGNVLR